MYEARKLLILISIYEKYIYGSAKPDIGNIEVCMIGKCEGKRFSIFICVSNSGGHHQISGRSQSYP